MPTMTKTDQTATRAKKPAMSNLSYDVLTVLQNKLEALAAYEMYLKDCRESGDIECQRLVAELKADDERHVERLRQELERMVRAGKFH
jgi:bacterioferritin (cytochrome b1)